jgi:hypothetical protein
MQINRLLITPDKEPTLETAKFSLYQGLIPRALQFLGEMRNISPVSFEL